MHKWYDEEYEFTVEVTGFLHGDYNGPCVKTKKQDIYHEQLLT